MQTPTLKVTGEVDQPREFTLDDLRQFAPSHQIPDASQVDPSRAGRAIWFASLLDAVKPRETVHYITLHASADDFHASLPLAEIRDRAFLIYELDGQPLPVKSGGPFRFAIQDSAACKSAEIDECANVKFVDWMEFSARPGQDNRPHDEEQHADLHRK